MQVGSPEWIEASLEKLEDLEQQRERHETALESAVDADSLREHSEAIERLDDEIKGLYAQLESVAEDDDDEAGEDEEAAAPTSQFVREEPQPPAPQPQPQAAPVAAAPQDIDPFGAPPPSSPPAASPAFGTSSSSFDAATDTSYELDAPSRGGGAKWAIIGLLVVGAGGGGYYAWQQQQASQQDEAAVVPESQVIKAGAIPDDTEGYNTPKGADVSGTQAEDYSKGKKRGGGHAGGNSGGHASGSKTKKKNNKHSIKIDTKSDNPLGN